ncbi:ATP-dependent nuclease [Carnobacterium viridans]|uniref:ATP-dependent nuclease n=1 Tax=Carnobacterium viridans TaxID=174587 RepID=UPI00226B0829|nr:AAA family ATPase [Carnobacterium viridans]
MFKENHSSINENGNEITNSTNVLYYKKVYQKNTDRKIYIKNHPSKLNEPFLDINTINEFIKLGFPEELIEQDNTIEPKINLPKDRDKKFSKADKNKFLEKYESDFDFFDYDKDSNEEWKENPGGFSSNVLSKLPKVIMIPVNDGLDNFSSGTGAMQSILKDLFNVVRSKSLNYIEADKHLKLLAAELDPQDESSDFGLMMKDLNGIIDGVFSGIGLNAYASLSDPQASIKPTFNVNMTSNVTTPIANQGTGVVRSAVFALLRYRAQVTHSESPLIICFEEPEIYLHPNAANQMRETIYSLSSIENNQIVCTTHSPYMIDLSKKPNQILNYISLEKKDIYISDELVKTKVTQNKPFNIMKGFKDLVERDKDYIKLILKMDDYLSRVFFSQRVLIVEGDTEEVVLRHTISLMPKELRDKVLNNWQIIRARGKPVIISLIKYLKALGIEPSVMHDKDSETPGAMIMNKPIKNALGNDKYLTTLENCIEDILGYTPPNSEKPYKAYKYVTENWKVWEDVTETWKEIVNNIFNEVNEDCKQSSVEAETETEKVKLITNS